MAAHQGGGHATTASHDATATAKCRVQACAFIARGACAEMLERVLTDHELIFSPWLLEELDRVLVTKLELDEGRSGRALAVILPTAAVIDAEPRLNRVCRDSDDDSVLALLRTSGASCLVTGDDDLPVLDPFDGIPIPTPRRFLADLG